MNFFLDKESVKHQGISYKMVNIKYENQIYKACSIRQPFMTIVVMANNQDIRIILLFGSKRIREVFEARLSYKILKIPHKFKIPSVDINLNNSNYHKFIKRMEPFLVELSYPTS